jgi:hypothetical protein
LTAGPLLSVVENGAIEYDGTSFYYTTGGVRSTIGSGGGGGGPTLTGITDLSNTSGSINLTPMAGNSVIVNQSTASTSTSTGALVVSGGVGVSGALNVGGAITASSTVTVNGETRVNGAFSSTAEKMQTSVNSGTALTLGTLSNGSIYRVTLTGNATLTLPSDPGISNAMAQVVVVITQDGTGSRTLTWAAPSGDSVIWSQATTPTVCSGINEKTIYQFIKINGDTTWYGTQVWRQCL